MGLSSPIVVPFGELRCRVFTSGPAGAPTIVLLPGLGMSHRYLARLHRELSKRMRVLTLDLPGMGTMMTPLAKSISVERYAELVAHVLEQRGVASCALFGHSMGTQIAIEMARLRPALVRRLILAAPVIDPALGGVVRQGLAVAHDFLGESFRANLVVSTDYLNCGPSWYLSERRAMMAYPTLRRVADAACPVLVLRGARDRLCGEGFARAVAAAAPEGSLHQLGGHGHEVQYTAAGSVADEVLTFLADRPSGSA